MLLSLKSRLLLLATTLFVAVLPGTFLHASETAGAADAIIVDTFTVALEPRQARSEWNGIVVAVQESSLTAQVPGRIDQIRVKAGDRVSVGQELAVIDARESAASQAQARAQLAQARAAQSGAQAEWERNQSLFERGFISQASLDDTHTRLAAARATVAQALAGVKRQSVTGSYLSVQAPYDGVISDVSAEIGEIAQPGRVLIRMLAPEALRVSLRVPTRLAGGLGVESLAAVQIRSQEISSTAEGDWSTPLPLQVMPLADPNRATVEVRIALPPALSEGLRPGAYIRVATFSPDGQGLFIPATALLRRGELNAAYVASGDRFVLRALRLGQRDGDRLEVLAGLRAGERIAADPVRAGLLAAKPAAAK